MIKKYFIHHEGTQNVRPNFEGWKVGAYIRLDDVIVMLEKMKEDYSEQHGQTEILDEITSNLIEREVDND